MKLMKKMLVWVMMLTLMTMGAWGAMAEQADAATDAADSWYEISADGTVVTVRLPLEAGLSWTAEISDDTLMELITEETENDLYVASFKAVDGQIGDVSLIFNLTDDTAEAARRTRVLEMTLGEGGQLNLLSVLEQDPEADWCELTDNVLTVRLPEIFPPAIAGILKFPTPRCWRCSPRNPPKGKTAARVSMPPASVP